MIIKSLLFILFSITLYARMIDGVAILVKDEPITLSDVNSALGEHGKSMDMTMDLLIRKKLEAQEAAERGITVSNQEVHDDIEKLAEQNGLSVRELYDNLYSSRKITQSQFKEQTREKLLNQKLFSAIAFSHMEEPTEVEIEEYYHVHKGKYTHAQRYDVIVYQSASKERLSEKVNNPMFYSPEVSSENQTLEYSALNPKLANLLEKTPLNSFSPVVSMQKSHYSFFVQEKHDVTSQPVDVVSGQIKNAIMGDKRKQVLNDYFARLRLNADIQIIRLPEQK
ncbi:MAG: SurA N-terminal domain-containing protein [Campylobacterota bacterium]|nr:SurA N-terminal domain-containing protein [Campylobacterota bacterium]